MRCVTTVLLILAVLGLHAGCSAPLQRVRPQYALHDPDPAKKIRAIKHVVKSDDHRHMDQLVELLEDEDDTVRFVAARALTRLSGRVDSPVGGTDPAATPDERRAHAEAWRAFLGDAGGGRAR